MNIINTVVAVVLILSFTVYIAGELAERARRVREGK